ncbi:MAG: cyclic pyranopterin monophosphate synthase MoaC, partial [Acidimicrobiales bacterium]
MNQPFSHTDATGQARMVDVSAKDVTRRVAEASCRVHASLDVGAPATIGEVDQVLAARLAGINAAKQTATLIPLCHPLNLEQVRVEIARTDDGYSVTSSVVSVTRTGVEMEALT